MSFTGKYSGLYTLVIIVHGHSRANFEENNRSLIIGIYNLHDCKLKIYLYRALGVCLRQHEVSYVIVLK